MSTLLISRLGESSLARLREQALARMLFLPTATVERVGKGDLLSRVGDDVSVMAKSVGHVVPMLVSSLLLVVLSVIAMLGIDYRLGLAGMVALPMYYVALRWYLPRSAPMYARQRVAMGERSQELISSLQGARTVRAYGLERAHLADIDAASARSRDILIAVFRLFTRFVGRGNRAELVGLAAILAVGFALVKQGAGTVGETTAAALIFHRLFNPIGLLLYTFDEVQSAGASLARLVGVITIPDEGRQRAVADRAAEIVQPGHARARVRPGRAREIKPVDARLVLRGVRHCYDGTHEVLHGVDLELAPGQRVAVVGSTGAGKTTLAGIAAGAISPTSGAVSIGGIPLATLGGRDLRRHVVIISQEVHVFAGPMIEDLRLARPEASQDDLEAALATVGALDWALALPEQLATEIGEGGYVLTASQAQQLALARLVLADPVVAVLDEATAEAGSAGARELEASADAATAGRTTLVVAHRLTQAAAADRVVVLEHGTVLEDGTHAELVAAGQRYSQLWHAWQGRG